MSRLLVGGATLSLLRGWVRLPDGSLTRRGCSAKRKEEDAPVDDSSLSQLRSTSRLRAPVVETPVVAPDIVETRSGRLWPHTTQ